VLILECPRLLLCPWTECIDFLIIGKDISVGDEPGGFTLRSRRTFPAVKSSNLHEWIAKHWRIQKGRRKFGRIQEIRNRILKTGTKSCKFRTKSWKDSENSRKRESAEERDWANFMAFRFDERNHQLPLWRRTFARLWLRGRTFRHYDLTYGMSFSESRVIFGECTDS
jgi:hypothetical protein